IVDENERAEKDRALEAFNSALYAYNLAEKEVYKDIGDEIEDVQNEINSLEDFTNKAFEDGIIDRAEAKAIEKYINTVNESFETIEASYNELMRNDLLLTVGKNTLKGWYNALLSAKNSLMNTILIAIEDGIATPAEKEAVDDAFIVYNNAMKEYQVAFEVAREAIEKERLKEVQQEIDEAKESVTDLGKEIKTAFSDESITNIEANNLDLLRKNLAKEVADVVTIATSISVSVVDINAKMSALNTEIGKYVGKSKYPIAVTVENRNAINTAFANLEASLVALYAAIDNKKIGNIEIGGRNLITDSTNINILQLYGATATYISVANSSVPSGVVFTATNITRTTGNLVFFIPIMS
ncbi:MAG TPA: hypothetical protein VFC79_04830, partial [Tissierellaceae bacterium]|nr:hypothetical protein [Tissierellaceae bacterium]